MPFFPREDVCPSASYGERVVQQPVLPQRQPAPAVPLVRRLRAPPQGVVLHPFF